MDRIDHRFSALILLLGIIGCASPGPPRAPSLGLPEPVTDLSVKRIGNAVELRFTPPSRSTDKLPLRGDTVTGVLCRELEHRQCVIPPGVAKTTVPRSSNGDRNTITWHDTLPEELTSGQPRLLGYRVEFFNDSSHSAGKSDAAYTAAGSPPAPVDGLHAEGSRLGVVLRWNLATSEEGDILLERENLAPNPPPAGRDTPKPKSPAASATTTLLDSNAPKGLTAKGDVAATLDTSALPDTPYRYIAVRRVKVQLGGRSMELQSAKSPATTFTLREIYPPPDPVGLIAAGFDPGQTPSGEAGFAIDLIWQPIDDAGLLAGLGGYNVYRSTSVSGASQNQNRIRLNQTPVPVPAFHDTSARPTLGYRYEVTAVDRKGNESNAATTTVPPSQVE